MMYLKRGADHRPEMWIQRTEGDLSYLTVPAFDETGIVNMLFSTRMGGFSKDEFGTMNLSFFRKDNPEAVLQNYKKITHILGCGIEDLVFSDQTHTANVRIVTEEDRGKAIVRKKDYSDVDGLITNVPGICLVTFFADCVPLLFVDPVKKVIAASHSGWRGTVGKIGQVTVQKMSEVYDTNPADIIVAVGPSICPDCYEVSEDVANAFREKFHNERIVRKGHKPGKYQLDLWSANEEILLDSGILSEHLFVTDICTCCNRQYLFSHRGSFNRRGNMGAFLMLK